MSDDEHRTRLASLTIGILAAVSLAAPAAAIEFFTDSGIEGSFDTTITFGGSLRLEKRDAGLVGRANGGTANSVNTDDGDLNFDRGDFTSLRAQVNQELSINYENYGFFGSVLYFYDAAIMDIDPERTAFTDSAKNRAGADFELKDLYVVGDFEPGELPLTVKIGNQVISWGESTFIPNGINVINPLDLTELRVAGAGIRDALEPIPAIDAALGLTDALSVEAFYQFDFEETELEPAGTFFSTNDFISPGGRRVFLGFGSDPDTPPFSPNPPIGPFVPRANDRDPSDQGQFGVALRYFAEQLNETEFGLYWIRYASRLPLISARTGTLAGVAAGNYAATASYFAEYPEDIDLFGLSFNTTVDALDVALQGEVSYRVDQPLQVDDAEILFAGLSPVNPAVFGQNQLGTFGFEEDIQGFRREDVFQTQATLTKLFEPTLGADSIVLVGEFGLTWIPDLPDKDELRFDGPGTYTSGNPFFTEIGVQPETQTAGFGDALSLGYRLLARADYLSAIGSVNLSPVVAFAHDVEGTTPFPLGTFVEGRKAVTLSLIASYLNAWQGEISYTNFFGGGDFNLVKDRDFVSLAVSYSF